ncbi:hypothetical protein DL89DRAFT_270520 [Linderina pennispora]|uniref:Uncharacterized protein n=1 Tax=Linderina pennispora TaxID=61395 RepID=A0A1Y1VXH3_9FUNG|nr:uncharacterized protein DL89DRAFT_270520 [Linderina pennispora]ORX65978.1 hypothetical protein DL89DRAFT_270520 [Linderina pennispora]
MRARKLLSERRYASITIHGLGAAIGQAIRLANTVKASLGDRQVESEVSTETITLYDDVISDDPTKDTETQARQNSAIRIKLSLKKQ